MLRKGWHFQFTCQWIRATFKKAQHACHIRKISLRYLWKPDFVHVAQSDRWKVKLNVTDFVDNCCVRFWEKNCDSTGTLADEHRYWEDEEEWPDKTAEGWVVSCKYVEKSVHCYVGRKNMAKNGERINLQDNSWTYFVDHEEIVEFVPKIEPVQKLEYSEKS